MIRITLPDQSIREFENPPSGMDVALSISEGFARNCIAVEVDGILKDLDAIINQDARVRLLTPKDPEALEILRHSSAHVMAEAVMHLYPEARLTIGPVVENGFYYDVVRAHV